MIPLLSTKTEQSKLAEFHARHARRFGWNRARLKRGLPVLAAALLYAMGLDGVYAADNDEKTEETALPPAVEARPLDTVAADSSQSDHRDVSGVDRAGPIKPGQTMTVWQKRVFVLGLEAGEKK